MVAYIDDDQVNCYTTGSSTSESMTPDESTTEFQPIRDGFGPGPAQPKLARAYIPTWPKIGPGPKAAQRTLAQNGLGPSFFGPGPAQKNIGPDKWPKLAQNYIIRPKVSTLKTSKISKLI